MRRVPASVIAIAILTAGCASAPAPTRSPSSASPKIATGIIAFSSNRNGAWNIYVVRTDGTGLTQLTRNTVDGAFDPTWSPDGTKIAYVAYSGPRREWHIWVMDADGSHEMPLGQRGIQPTWSPEGTKIAYARQTGAPYLRIYMMNTDGTGKRPVTAGPVCDGHPAWAPNGMIVFSRNPGACNGLGDQTGDLFAVNPDGGEPVRLMTEQSFGYPSLSPDGTRIAIQDKKRHRIVILRTYGGSTVTLVPTDFGADWVQAGWSPDGNTVAIAGSYTNMVDLYVVNADGTGLTKVPNGEEAADPAWRPAVPA